MKTKVLAIAMVFAVFTAAAQKKVLVLSPQIGSVRDLSKEAQKKFEDDELRYNKLMEKQDKGVPLSSEEIDFLAQYQGTEESIWDVLPVGCSWYCGGGPYKIESSSALKTSPSGISYGAENAHDLSLKTAWAEGVTGYGVGESLTYYFSNSCPRITWISIYNGYVKSQEAWKNNARVKKLNVYENDVLLAIFLLDDTQAEQGFELPEPLGRREDGLDLVLRFEIAEVYKGNKYEDTAITELFFSGLDVHCIGEGSQILMADGSLKNIELVEAGETILQYVPENNRMLTSCVVSKLVEVTHSGLLELTLEDGKQVVTTDDHPFYVEGKGWCSYNPEKTAKYQRYAKVGKYALADRFVVVDLENGELKEAILVGIKQLPDTRKTYTLELEGGVSFVANGFVVGEERLK